MTKLPMATLLSDWWFAGVYARDMCPTLSLEAAWEQASGEWRGSTILTSDELRQLRDSFAAGWTVIDKVRKQRAANAPDWAKALAS